MSRSGKRCHNMDIVLHGPMPSEPCPPSMYAQGRHAFTAPVRALAMSSVTTNADRQIVEVAPGVGCRSEMARKRCSIARRSICSAIQPFSERNTILVAISEFLIKTDYAIVFASD